VTREGPDRDLGRWLWLLPLLLLLSGTIAAWVFDLDLSISRRFHRAGAKQPWPIGNTDLAHFLEDWVWLPAATLAVVAGVLMVASARRRRRNLLRAGLILLVSLLLGPLLLTNTVLKPYYGRPRPQDVTEFGGKDRFRPVLKPTFGGSDSFPSGHAATAFALMLPFFVLRRSHRRSALTLLLLGIAYGTLIGCVRIAHGRHFFTDVLWAGGLVWFTGLGVTALVERLFPLKPSPS